MIVGGTAQLGNWSTEVDENETQSILDRVEEFEPTIKVYLFYFSCYSLVDKTSPFTSNHLYCVESCYYQTMGGIKTSKGYSSFGERINGCNDTTWH